MANGDFGSFGPSAELIRRRAAEAIGTERRLSGLRREDITERGQRARERLLAGLARRGLGITSTRGGLGIGEVESLDRGIGRALSSEAIASRGRELGILSERDLALQQLLDAARQERDLRRSRRIGPLDIASLGVSALTNLGGITRGFGAIGKVLGSIF